MRKWRCTFVGEPLKSHSPGYEIGPIKSHCVNVALLNMHLNHILAGLITLSRNKKRLWNKVVLPPVCFSVAVHDVQYQFSRQFRSSFRQLFINLLTVQTKHVQWYGEMKRRDLSWKVLVRVDFLHKVRKSSNKTRNTSTQSRADWEHFEFRPPWNAGPLYTLI